MSLNMVFVVGFIFLVSIFALTIWNGILLFRQRNTKKFDFAYFDAFLETLSNLESLLSSEFERIRMESSDSAKKTSKRDSECPRRKFPKFIN